MMGHRSLSRLLVLLGILLAWPALAAAGDLGNAQLVIAGSQLTVSPESQTVPFDTPTIVETHLEGYDASRGVIPADLRVLADFTGPEIDGVLVLETTPNQPFHIPSLRQQGEYRLDNIRLMQGSALLAYAAPRSSAVLVTQVLITRVTSRALTLDEIRSYGIVVDDSSFQAFSFTFAFAVAGETVNYNVPVLIYSQGGSEQAVLWQGSNFEASPWRSSSAHFEPPQMAPFQLQFASTPGDTTNGGCTDPEGDCAKPDVLPIPGVILFPTNISLLHQFFSVVLMAQNGAPAGDPLTIRDLTARVTLPPGLRQAKTAPPTPLGVPIPVRVPGPDGILGTADDITFLVAQATGQAEVDVEGLTEGTHIVRFDLDGILEGLPGNQIRRVTGQAQGAVLVRDPTLNVTITHPDVVRTDEAYTLLLTVTNTGNTPANQLTVRLPAEKLSGVQVVGESEKTVTVQPGDAELVEFQLKSLRTGRVTATAARSDSSSVTAVFDLTMGVGENGIPLSPNAIILPDSTSSLPPDLLRSGLSLVGLGFSLATAPPSLLRPDLPQVSRSLVDQRVFEFAEAGSQVSLGEEMFDSAAQFASEWTGARDADWDWDLLRRTTQKGAQVGVSLGTIFAVEAAQHSPQEAFDRFASTTGYLATMEGALATGSGVTLEVASRTGGQRLKGDGNDAERLRELPFGDVFNLGNNLGNAQMALLAVPEPGGYRARIQAAAAVTAGLHLLVPAADGSLRMVRWASVPLAAGGSATVEFLATDSTFTLAVDTQGDGIVDAQISGSVEVLQRRPFQALAAVQNASVDPTGHVVDVLFTSDVDPAALVPGDPRKFTIPGKVSNGGSVQAEMDVTDGAGSTVSNPFAGLRNTRIVRVVFNNPLSPYAQQEMTVSGVTDLSGAAASSTTLRVRTTATDPGILVAGRVYGSDGNPAPFALVELRESDLCLFCADTCSTHKTAAVQADAGGNFLFDYVRQTDCSDVYQLKATDPISQESGTATGRVRLIGQQVQLDVVMLGRGTINGRVTYDDGTVPAGARVIADSPVFRQGRAASLDANGNYSLTNVPVGTTTLSATDGQGRFTVTTIELPDAGSVVNHDLVILRRPDQPVATGDVRGVIYRPDGTTPVSGAYVALYVDGNLVGVKNSAADGTFDFGPVPVGSGEIETFEGVTGESGVQVYFDVKPDQVNAVNLVMRDERGVVEGYVYHQTAAGNVPLFGIVVWAEGTPFQTVTNPQGYYRLEGVFAGTRNISAADTQRQVKVSQPVTIGDEGQVVERNLYFQDTAVSGIAGVVLGYDGNPAGGATVHLANGDQNWFRTATTDSSGQFQISDLGVGTYGVHAFKGAAGGAVGATVRFAGDTPFVTIAFKKGAIHGVVKVDNGGAAPVGTKAVITYRTTVVRLELVGLDLESHTLETSDDGTFDIPDVLAGPYVITASNAFYGSQTVRGTVAGNGTETVAVTFNGTSTGTVRGVVLAPDGVTPVAGATVKLVHPSFSTYDVTSGADGSFAFELVPPVAASFPVNVTASDGLIFRQAQAWVQLNKPGQELDLEIVLPQQGAISGTVEDSDGTPVPGAVVTLQEGSYPHRNLIVNADAGGSFAYQNIFAGTVTLSAKAPSLGGLGGKTTTQITAEGQQVTGVVISLEPTGKIAGRVTSPVDGSAVPSSEIHLLRGGRLFDTVTAGPDGSFEFALLPLATYDLTAFDPHTGRYGQRLSLVVAANDQVVAGDFELEARGSVGGHLYESGTTVGVPGGTIRLQTDSIVGFTTYSSTDADGAYQFGGIPQGTFQLFGREPVGRRRATGRGEITSEGEQVTLDLFLDPQATLFGSVLNPIGAPDGVFPNANTVIYQDGQIIGATLDSNYSFPGVIVGRSYELYAQEVGGGHGGQVFGTVSTEGQVRVDVRVHPIGSVKINVLDSFGHPVPGAQIDMWDQTYYGDFSGFERFRGDTGSDNSLTFQSVGEGKLSVYVTDPATGLQGSVGGALNLDGQIVEINVSLQNSAQITGHVVLPDGTTPAAQALVAIQTAGRTLTLYTDDTGAFTLPSLPLGSFLLVLEQHLGPGTREVRGTLTSNGQLLDLGTVVLDAVDPQVVAMTPAPGAVDVPRTATVTVRFSEPMDTTRNLVGNLVRIETAAGVLVGADAVWIDGDTAVQATPRQPLANASIFRLTVDRGQLFDKAGRELAQSAQTTFTTADQVPPAVIAVTPASGARQVPLDAPLRVTFSEVVDPATLSGSALQLTDLTANAGVSTTFFPDPTGRSVTVNPVTALMDGHRYQLTGQGVADTVGNVMPVPFVLTFQALDATAPSVAITQPAADGVQVHSGDRLTVSANVTDLSAVSGVTLRLGNWSLTKTAPPYSWLVPAPIVTSAGPVSLQIDAVDEWGNHGTASRSLQVTPHANANAPQVALHCLPGGVPAGLEIAVPFHASDDESIASYRLTVNGQEVTAVPLVDQAAIDVSLLWTVPASAHPGDVFTLRIEATDFAGNTGSAEVPLTVNAATVLTASQMLDSSFNGQSLMLSQGTFTLSGPVHLAALTLTRGARVTAAAGSSRLDLAVDGRFEVGCDATIDSFKLGFAGGTAQHLTGHAPDGVTTSQGDAGGSHAGVGDLGDIAGAAGGIFDSVYQPASGGGGGGFHVNQEYGSSGGAGGGMLALQAGELVLDGRILSRGETRPVPGEQGGGGAGGTVAIQAAALHGGGTIEVSGGDSSGCSSGAGGGGRVALRVSDLTGFDPGAQVLAWGGSHPGCSNQPVKYGAPGTLYVFDASSTFGRLIVDAGQAGSVDRTGPATELPALGSGAVTAWSVAGADAWVSAATAFQPEWLGAWMDLKDASGTSVGSGFKVAEIDAQGRARLAGAAAVTGAASWTGEYRFDGIDLRHGAGLSGSTPVAGQEVVLQGDTALTGDVTATNVTVKAGARVHPVTGGTLRFHVASRMTVESGAVVDVRNLGYAGGEKVHHPVAYGPPEVAPSQPANGGSHGGAGGPGTSNTGPAGGVFDSVYQPGIPGGGGAITDHSFYGSNGGAGGGLVAIDAAELVLDGQILASGETRITTNEAGGGGAGGAVAIQAGTLRGAGAIDVSGGDANGCGGSGGAGGGGRVALRVQTFDGFVAANQVTAFGGVRKDCEGTLNQAYYYGAAGTIFTSDSTATYGRLAVDAGQVSGADRVGVATELPQLAAGAVVSLQAAGSDAWLTAAASFQPEWLGTWVTLQDASGAPLGTGFQAMEVDSQGRLRLAGAATVSGAAGYRGEYRFDAVQLSHGAGLWSATPIAAGDVTLGGSAGVGDGLSATTMTVLAGAAVRPVSGQTVHLKASGTLTVQAGGRVDVSGLGYAAGANGHPDGWAPDGVRGSTLGGGGSHGGSGLSWNGPDAGGEIYDSLFAPALGGGGGSEGGAYYSIHGIAGGGVVQLEAGTLDLEGDLRARGADDDDAGTASGAGGSVRITAATVTGAGHIDASGGFARSCSSHNDVGSGGGGRVSLAVGAFSGFDPAVQVLAQGGPRYSCDRSTATFAAPGTVFTRLPSQTYGTLRVNQGATGTPTVAWTALPRIGRGTVGAVTAAGSDLWITPADANATFSLGVVGLWVSAGGTDYLILDESADRRQLLLAGAAGQITPGAAFFGVYKLDAVSVAGGARLTFGDDKTVLGTVNVDAISTLQYADYNAPTVAITLPTASTFTSGDPIAVAATATDDRSVSQILFRLGSNSSIDTQAPYQWSTFVPSVATATDLELRAEATDAAGNLAVATKTLHVQPLAPTSPPTVAFLYPGAGALLPIGIGVDLQIQATDDRGVERVELYVDGAATPLTVLTASPYNYHLDAPAGAVDGQILNLRAVAYDYSRQTAEATIPVRVIQPGTVISSGKTLDTTDISLDGTSVVVAGGTLVVTGPHTFRDLVVLDGANVIHPSTSPTQEYHLDLTIQRDLFVAQGGKIDVTGRGYKGAPGIGQRSWGYGNVQTEGADDGVGGSYGGRGGVFDGSSPIYGSFYDPADPGAGGGATSSSGGSTGGGVVRVTASGNVVVDGTILAGGGGGFAGGGAGGSIRLNGVAIRGAGSIQASGSGYGAAGGSGGRIALYAATIDSGLVTRVQAPGGKISSIDATTWGAAGTVFVKPDSQLFGDLILDNAGIASTQLTELLPVGSGIVDAVSTDSFTDNEADFRHVLGAADVVFNGDFAHPYTITGNSHHGTALTLQVPAPPLSAAVHVGDSYQGLYRFNRVVVRGGARGIARDQVTLTSPNTPEVASGSAWTSGYTLPTIQITSPAVGAAYTSGSTFTAAVTLQDSLGVHDVQLLFNGQSSTVTSTPFSFSPVAPEVTQGTDFPLAFTATDLSGNRLTATRSVHVDPAVDPSAPVVTLASCHAAGTPTNAVNSGDLVTPGVAITIPFVATDDQAVQSYSLVVNGTTVQTVGNLNQATVPAVLTWTPPANAAAGSIFNLRVEARDYSGEVGFAALTLAVPAGSLLTGTQTLTSAVNGQSLVLGAGTFMVQQPLSLASLTLLNGARVVGLSGGTTSLTTSGALTLQCGAVLDVSALGYAGGLTASSPGGAPAGITASASDAGGSHGGTGALGSTAGPAGDIYDSVYQPQLGGGGGSLRLAATGRHGGNGGGLLTLNVGQLVLNGQIWSQGEQRPNPGNTDSSGAGGSVSITA
ncbi:MAG TPA: carboxypeptidase regulatory-like domain-containing protein, partial [Thermoanaerobaculia bacterium]|nr:carboxypeptidase regulatory-like domain-containing protein [Thermoanaerobaculia bacterium]